MVRRKTCKLLLVQERKNLADRYTLKIPGRAVPKGRPRFSRTGGVYNPKTTNDYERLVANTWYAKYGDTAIEGNIEAQIVVATDRHLKQDVDNLAKSVLDGLQKGGAFAAGDQQVYKLAISKIPADKENCCVVVALNVISGYSNDY